MRRMMWAVIAWKERWNDGVILRRGVRCGAVMTWLQLGQGPVMPAMACGTVRAVPQAALDVTQPVEHLGILFFDGEGGGRTWG